MAKKFPFRKQLTRLLVSIKRLLMRGRIRRYGFYFSTSHPRMNPQILDAFKRNTYEAPEIKLIQHYVGTSDRVVEIGICAGATSLVISKIVGSDNLILFEADPRNADFAQTNFLLNGLELDLRQRALWSGPDRPKSVTMYSAKNASSSSLIDRGITEEKFTVETEALEEVIDRFQPTVICADIEGGEVDLFLRCEDFGSVRKLLFETHARVTGQEAVDAMISHIKGAGFMMQSADNSDFVAMVRD